MLLILAVLLFPCIVSAGIYNAKSVGVSGIFTCDQLPENAVISLFDRVRMFPDELLERDDIKGNFEFQVSKNLFALFSFKPYIQIDISCHDGLAGKNVSKRIQIDIPQQYIEDGDEATKLYEMRINLEDWYPQLDCGCFLPGEDGLPSSKVVLQSTTTTSNTTMTEENYIISNETLGY